MFHSISSYPIASTGTNPARPLTSPTKRCSYLPSPEETARRLSFLQHQHKCQLSGPNCWGTATYLLNIIPTFRFVCETEFKDFLSQATIIEDTCVINLREGAVLCFWNNVSAPINEIHHAALCLGGENFFEKAGPESEHKPIPKTLETIFRQAQTTLYSHIPVVNVFEQEIKGKYATFLDFSRVNPVQTSAFEEKLHQYHVNGELLNEKAMQDLCQTYRAEINNEIENPRELSLAEGFLTLLDDIRNEFTRKKTEPTDKEVTDNRMENQTNEESRKALVRKNRMFLIEYRTLDSLVEATRPVVLEQIKEFYAKISPVTEKTETSSFVSGYQVAIINNDPMEER